MNCGAMARRLIFVRIFVYVVVSVPHQYTDLLLLHDRLVKPC